MWTSYSDLENCEKRFLLFAATRFVAINWTRQLCYHPCIPRDGNKSSGFPLGPHGAPGPPPWLSGWAQWPQCWSLLCPDGSPVTPLSTHCPPAPAPAACSAAPSFQHLVSSAPATFCLKARPLQPSPHHPSCAPHTTDHTSKPQPLPLWPSCPAPC